MGARASEISWTGEFVDPALERAFAKTSVSQSLGGARLCIIATTVTCLSFVPLDVTTLPADLLPFYLGDRLLIALICLGALMALTRFKDFRHIATITYTQQYVFFTLNALIFHHPVLLRHGGALLPLIAISLFMCLPGSFRAAAGLCAFAPGISLYFWGVARPQPEAPQDLSMIVLMILVAYAVGAVARCQLNRMRREGYLHIERERQVNHTLLEAKEAAEAGSRAKADFLAVMSHEIRTPMNGVLGMVRLVLDSGLAPQDHHRLEIACQSAEGLLTILDDILHISKLDSGSVEFESEPFALLHTIESVAALMGTRVKEKGLSLTLDMDPSMPDWVRGDSARLRQILFNLIGNAVKFTESGGVTVRAQAKRLADGRIQVDIAVSDTGIGIDANQQQRIFQAFGQADPSISRRFGGTGLGLVICKKLIEGMGGTIGVHSVPGQGSCFRVTLAFIPAQRVESATVPSAMAAAPLSILLTEDNPINREVAEAYLLKAGHRVTMAVNGAEAVEHASRGGFDLILMDMHMPIADGPEATRRIRALPGPLGQVPIIALTANAMAADVVRCRAAGMDAHIAKPMTPNTLNATIAQVMASGRMAASAKPLSFDVLLMGESSSGLGDALKALGHRLFAVSRDEAALVMLAARAFDLVILAPGEAARVEAARKAAARWLPRPAVLAVSIPGQEGALSQAGADEVLPANPTTDELAAAIARHLPATDDLVTLLGDERVAQLRTLLLESLREDAGILAQDGLSAEGLALIAHRIKGSAATMRLTELAAAADAVMRNAETSFISVEALDIARHELHTSVNKVIVALSGFAPASIG